jgi:hypothetical protein
MVKHTVEQTIKVLENPHLDGQGRRHAALHCEYVNGKGTQVTGDPNLQSILKAVGIEPRPGETLKITVELLR